MFTTPTRRLFDNTSQDMSDQIQPDADKSDPGNFASFPANWSDLNVSATGTPSGDSSGSGGGSGGSGGFGGGGGTVTVSTPGSGLVFVNTYDASCTTAYENCIVAAEKTLESLFTNSVTVNVTFKEANKGSGFALSNNWPSWVNVSYSQLKSALPASDSLPATDPNPAGGKDWALPEAYARMLGLSASTPSTDDTVTLNTYYGWSFGQDVVNGLEHELSEGVMGRVGGLGDQNGVWSTMDLFRYSAPGVHDYKDGRDGKTTYFSSDGKVLSSGAGLSFNNEYNKSGTKVNGGDTADWTETAVFGSTATGETLTVSQTELNLLTALGWTPALPQDVFTAGTADWQTFTAWSNGSMPITPEDAFIGVLSTSQATSNANVTVNSIGTNLYSSLIIANDSTFTATNGTVLNPADTSTWASGNIGTIEVEGGSNLVIGNAFDNSGSLTIGVNNGVGGNANLKINGSVKLNGGGTLNLGQYSSHTFSTGTIENFGSSKGKLTNVNNTITGGGTIGLYSFDNQAKGTVEASQEEGNWLQVYGTNAFTNEGTMVAETRSTLDLGQDGHTRSLTNKGSIKLDSEGDLAISGNFTVAGSGAIDMNGAWADITSDASGAATFTNESTITASASGQIGDEGVYGVNDLTFDNVGGKVVVSGSGNVLTLNTGSHTITDSGGGLFEAKGGGQLIIDSNVDTGGMPTIIGHNNAGTIEAAAGSEVTISAAIAPGVSGPFYQTGEMLISGNGTIDLASGASVSTPIAFSGTGGALQVDSATDSVTGQISGFTGGDYIDARFMPFTSSVTAQWNENSGGTAGTLMLSDGGSTSMTFNLSGNYTSTPFTVASDGHGGTLCHV
jgi:hypothetical protein